MEIVNNPDFVCAQELASVQELAGTMSQFANLVSAYFTRFKAEVIVSDGDGGGAIKDFYANTQREIGEITRLGSSIHAGFNSLSLEARGEAGLRAAK